MKKETLMHKINKIFGILAIAFLSIWIYEGLRKEKQLVDVVECVPCKVEVEKRLNSKWVMYDHSNGFTYKEGDKVLTHCIPCTEPATSYERFVCFGNIYSVTDDKYRPLKR